MMPVTKEALKSGLSTIRSGSQESSTQQKALAQHTVVWQLVVCVIGPPVPQSGLDAMDFEFPAML